MGVQLASIAKCELQRVRSGDEGWPDLGTRVGWLVLRRERLLSSMELAKAEPLPELSWTGENQVGLWALKSPVMMVGAVWSRRRERSGLKLDGQEDEGGM